jgi:hypothetical protein
LYCINDDDVVVDVVVVDVAVDVVVDVVVVVVVDVDFSDRIVTPLFDDSHTVPRFNWAVGLLLLFLL